MLYSGFNNFPRSVFWSADLNGRSYNTDVIQLGPTMKRKILIAAAAMVVLVVVFYAFVARRSLQKSHHGNVVRMVISFCHEHVAATGDWPISWADLESSNPSFDWNFAKRTCSIDFDITCEDVADMSVDDFDAVSPTGLAYKPESTIDMLIAECAKTAQ